MVVGVFPVLDHRGEDAEVARDRAPVSLGMVGGVERCPGSEQPPGRERAQAAWSLSRAFPRMGVRVLYVSITVGTPTRHRARGGVPAPLFVRPCYPSSTSSSRWLNYAVVQHRSAIPPKAVRRCAHDAAGMHGFLGRFLPLTATSKVTSLPLLRCRNPQESGRERGRA